MYFIGYLDQIDLVELLLPDINVIYIMYTNKIDERADIYEPKDAMLFHPLKASW